MIKKKTKNKLGNRYFTGISTYSWCECLGASFSASWRSPPPRRRCRTARRRIRPRSWACWASWGRCWPAAARCRRTHSSPWFLPEYDFLNIFYKQQPVTFERDPLPDGGHDAVLLQHVRGRAADQAPVPADVLASLIKLTIHSHSLNHFREMTICWYLHRSC